MSNNFLINKDIQSRNLMTAIYYLLERGVEANGIDLKMQGDLDIF